MLRCRLSETTEEHLTPKLIRMYLIGLPRERGQKKVLWGLDPTLVWLAAQPIALVSQPTVRSVTLSTSLNRELLSTVSSEARIKGKGGETK